MPAPKIDSSGRGCAGPITRASRRPASPGEQGYKGFYWWDSQMRGTAKSSVVLKDYEVHSGKGVIANRGEDSLSVTNGKTSP